MDLRKLLPVRDGGLPVIGATISLLVLAATGSAAPELPVGANGTLCPCYYSAVGVFCRPNYYEFFVRNDGAIDAALLDTRLAVKTMTRIFPKIAYSVRVVAPRAAEALPQRAVEEFADIGIDVTRANVDVDADRLRPVVVVRFVGDVAERPFSSANSLGQPAPIGEIVQCTTAAGRLGFDPAAVLIDLNACMTSAERSMCIHAVLAKRAADVKTLARGGRVGILALTGLEPDEEAVADEALRTGLSLWTTQGVAPALLPTINRRDHGLMLVVVPLPKIPSSRAVP